MVVNKGPLGLVVIGRRDLLKWSSVEQGPLRLVFERRDLLKWWSVEEDPLRLVVSGIISP